MNRDRKLQEDIRQKFISNSFSFIKYVEQKNQEITLFPTEFYNSTYDIITTFLNNKDKYYHQNIEFFVAEIFLSYNYEKNQFLHKQTIYSIWNNLCLLVENDEDDKIIQHWKTSHQYCMNNLSTYNIIYDDNYNETSESKEIRSKLEYHKNQFIEIHTILGAYLMHKKKYLTLHEAWFITQSQPAQYVLILQNMADIFTQYFLFMKSGIFEAEFPIHYYFKNLEFDAMNGKQDVRSVVRDYLCLLFLKQWETPWHYGISRLTIPPLPTSQADNKYWQENIKFFRNKTDDLLGNKDLLKDLKLDWISDDECKNRSLPTPGDFITNLEQALVQGFEETLSEAELDPEALRKLDDSIIDSISSTHSVFSRINGEDIRKEDRDLTSETMQVIRGSRILLDKEAFIDNQSTTYIGFDTLLGSQIKTDYYFHIAVKFNTNASTRYEVKSEDIFKAVDKLNIRGPEFGIISFNMDLGYLKASGRINLESSLTDEDYRYNGIPIYCFDLPMRAVDRTFFVLRRADFPMIKHKDWKDITGINDDAKIQWNDLELIDDRLKIYRKVTELRKDPVLLEKSFKNGPRSKSELLNMVDVNVDFLGYCWFKKDIKMIAIRGSSIFQEGGVINTLQDIKSFTHR